MANQRLTDIPNVPGALESLSSKHMQKRILGVVANNNTKLGVLLIDTPKYKKMTRACMNSAIVE